MQGEQAIGIHVFIEERRQRASVGLAEPCQQLVVRDGPFDEERVNEHQAVLQELETQRGDLLLGTAVGGKDPLPAVAEEVVRRIPPFDDVQPFVDLVAQVERR